MEAGMIVVTGASGKLGGLVVEALLARIPAGEVAVAVRDPASVEALATRGVGVRPIDIDDAEGLVRAFDGAERALLVSLPLWGDAAVTGHRTMVDAAKRAGVGRVLYTSHTGADRLSAFEPAAGHARTEGYLLESGIPFTSLRNGFYPDTPIRWAQEAARSGELRLPADGPVSWTAREDLAAATAALLADPSLSVPVINLTAAEAVDADGLAAITSEVTGRSIRRVTVSDDEYRAGLVAAGVPAFGAAVALSIVEASRQRRMATVDPALERLTGRPAASIEEILRVALA